MNDEQIAYWNGLAGQRWTEQQDVLDRALAAYGRAILERAVVRPGEHVLDIGSGCGATSLALSDAVGLTGNVLGVDISARMLARARERAEGRPNLIFLEGDASSLEFSRKFELLFSRFGVMFFEDPVAAFGHLRNAAVRGGRLAFVCWRAYEDNPWASLPVDAVRHLVPDVTLPTGDSPGPYAFADPAKVQRILSSAGFGDIAIDRFDADVVLGEGELDEAVEFAVRGGPAARLLAAASPDVQARARDAVRRVLEPLRTATGFALPGSGWLVTART
jgi:SAM-dependent methyltransferase